MRTRVLGLAVVGAAALGIADPARATISDGEVVAAASGSTPANRALSKLALTYDSVAGTITAKGTFQADPSAGVPAAIAVHFGSVSGGTCGPPKALIVAQLAPGGAISSSTSAAPSGTNYGGTISFDGNAAIVTATAEGLKNLPYSCLFGSVATLDSARTVLAETDGWGPVVARPEPGPPSTPAPTPAPPPAQPPAPTTPVTAPPPAAKLTLGVTGVPEVVTKLRWVTAKVQITNAGTATAKDVRLKVLRRKGVTILPSVVTLKRPLRAGKSKTVKVKLRLGASAGNDVAVRLRATGKGKLRAEGTVGLVTKAGRPAPVGSTGPLKGRYFWGFKSRVDYVWDNYAVYFASDGWAYWGFKQDGGLPVDCKAQAPVLSEKGEPTGDGCFAVTFDKATGALTVGPYTGTWKDGKLTLDEVEMKELLIPAPGYRVQAELEHRGFRGFCGLITGCSTWHYRLGLTNEGNFVKTSSSLTTIGDGWTSPYVAAGSYPPDQYGTYAVLENGLMQLSFADGSVKRYPFGVQLKDGKPDPAGEGVLLGEHNYYVDPTPGD